MIAIATLMRPKGHTGVQSHTRSLADGLTAAGIECTVVSPFTGTRKWLPVFAVRRLLLPLRPNWSTRWYRHWHEAAMRERLRRLPRTDILIAQDPLSARAALDTHAADVTILVCHFNSSQAEEFAVKGELSDAKTARRIEETERDVFRRVDHVVYVSTWAQEEIEVRRGHQTQASSVVRNGIPDASPQALRRETLGLNETDVVLITVGTLEPRKNQLELIQLFARLENPHARLLIAGDGPDRKEIERAARPLGNRVRVLGARDDIPSLLALADVYVHLARAENLPLAILEAARASRPIAAVPAGGIAELVEDLGIVTLDHADPKASLEKLRRLVTDASLRHETGAHSRTGYERGFTEEAMVRGYVEALGLSTEPPHVVPRLS